MGVEPTSSAWKAEIIAVIPHLHMVHGMGLEPTRDYSHYPLKVACLPIPPPVHMKFCFLLCIFIIASMYVVVKRNFINFKYFSPKNNYVQLDVEKSHEEIL